MALNWFTLDEPPSTKRSFTFYGPPGSGKTTAAGTFPRPLFLFPKNENSYEAIRGQAGLGTEIASMSDLKAACDWLLGQQHQGTLSQYCDTVVVENLSHYSEIVDLELTNNGQKNMDWGRYGAHFAYMRNVLWQLDAHIVFTAWDHVKTDKNGNIVRSGLKLYGQVAEAIPGCCDVVGYCESVETTPDKLNEYWVHFRKWKSFDARTRIKGMPAMSVQNFSFAEHIAPYL